MSSVTDHRLVSLNMPMLEELRAQLGASAKLRRTTMQDLLHELLCRGLGRDDLLELAPGTLTRRDDESADG
jgi:hypothetical protein